MLLLGYIFNPVKYYKEFISWFKSEHESFVDEKYITGMIVPFTFGDTIKFRSGTGFKIDYEVGQNASGSPITFSEGCNVKGNAAIYDDPITLTYKIVNHTFVISLKIIDFENHVVAEINDNKLKIRKDEIDDYKTLYSSPQGLEIIDKSGYTIFSMWLDDQRQIQIRGYFVGSLCTFFLTGNDNYEYVENTNPHFDLVRRNHASKISRHFLK